MSSKQKVIIGILSIVACVLLVLLSGMIITYGLPFLSSVDTQVGNPPTFEAISTPTTIQNSQQYVIDEVLWAVGCGRGAVSITYSNNTGGTNQWAGGIGDGKSHNPQYCDSYMQDYKPFRTWFSAQYGDVFTLIAQVQDDSQSTGIVCNIYLADYQGAQCLVNENQRCGKITLWKSASCYGAYCICQTSGLVDTGQ